MIQFRNDSDINEIICLKYPKFTSNTKSSIVENVLEAIKSLGDLSTTRAIRDGYRNLSLRCEKSHDSFVNFERSLRSVSVVDHSR